ncbi:MAG: Arginine-tRNA ligase [Candidatus Roizmanbacteria bacterium GW2011_GWA2_35_8]|uniref:Arginine--tRNA ligase n=1 Tax=Candidatus Roizmanbacteria bacterium GW2011_GWA2_35_8 TaxID=1618479 RepID=A0A0G0FI51_9BACT|nr:MAG: Arginine-tRNA ligase [Candidatus Roizmanbacteria bacterium GW2011_GWA2_35_8]
MIKEQILKVLIEVIKKLAVENIEVDLQPPANAEFGDYSSSIALKLTKILKKNPMEIAEEIKKNIPKNSYVEKIEVIKPGFINFWISKVQLTSQLHEFATEKFDFSKYHFGPNKKVMVEFAHPNTLKLFHIGHLRNISTGETVVRILEAVGNKVIRSNYQGDVGLHTAKCLYAVRNKKLEMKKLKTTSDKTKFIGKMYTEGTRAYEEDPKAKEEILKINKMIYDRDPEIMRLWEETRKWSLDYFDEVYKRVYSHFDRLYFESEFYERGTEVCMQALKSGILEKSQGAIVFNGKKYGLDTRVFINSLGFPTYEGKELGLAEKEFSDFGELDKNIHCVTPEQSSFFKITFKVEELLNEKKYKNKQYHLAYNWVNLKEGKMSSRVGNIIEGPWLIDETKKKIIEKFKCDNETAEVLAVASVKYSFLKQSVTDAIAFDLEESIAVDGNSAPYLIYTYVRCQSILRRHTGEGKTKLTTTPESNKDLGQARMTKSEIDILRKFTKFPEIVHKAAVDLSPNDIANYIYDLASLYNAFYQKNPILKADVETKKMRLSITLATANIIKKGLDLLGIKTVERM